MDKTAPHGILILLVLITSTSAILQDYYPLAVGNWWELGDSSGNFKKIYEIIDIDKDTAYSKFTFISVADLDTNVSFPKMVSIESTACAGEPHCLKSRFCSAAPHFAIPSKNTAQTPAGEFKEIYSFRKQRSHNILFDCSRPIYEGWRKTTITYTLAPGIGLIKESYFISGCENYERTSWENIYALIDYNIMDMPAGCQHTWKLANHSQDSFFSSQVISPDTVEIKFNMRSDDCTKFYALSSFHAGYNTLRIYLADTSSDSCGLTKTFEHTIKIKNMTNVDSIGIKVYFTENLILLYSKKIGSLSHIASFSSTPNAGIKCWPNPFSGDVYFFLRNKGVCRIHKLEVYDITGKLLTSNFSLMHSPFASKVRWNGRDNAGNPVSPGIYLIKLKTKQRTYSQKVLLH